MGFFSVTRLLILSFTLMLAIVVLGVSAHLIAIRTTDYWRFAALAVAVSSLTILTFPVILIISLSERNRKSSGFRISESAWLTIMWILWLSTGANATRAARSRFFPGACSFISFYSSQICNEFRVVEAFSYIIFVFLLCYSIAVIVKAFTADDRTQATRGGDSEAQKAPQSQMQGQQPQ
ncbi:uncharacterized protein EDB91DRAFT_298188 [Suillus paluster]|uniref:uncharacterized protein n=1 Tax=Suillus paluster TaxID=48578 RepID=UPI001B87F871|nr:uncharacterized protein EDB91DRAFT_298188 [Suillus paluster]KAG1742785.1 hypothetical protein EDB91DRAFT_298188 [Suillus paluster]